MNLSDVKINGASITWRCGLEKDIDNTFGEVQEYVDITVLRLSEPYTPFDTGNMSRSGSLYTTVGSGTVEWNTPYVRRQYYTGRLPGRSKSGRLRGRLWFERMKKDRGEEIIKGAQRRMKGK